VRHLGNTAPAPPKRSVCYGSVDGRLGEGQGPQGQGKWAGRQQMSTQVQEHPVPSGWPLCQDEHDASCQTPRHISQVLAVPVWERSRGPPSIIHAQRKLERPRLVSLSGPGSDPSHVDKGPTMIQYSNTPPGVRGCPFLPARCISTVTSRQA